MLCRRVLIASIHEFRLQPLGQIGNFGLEIAAGGRLRFSIPVLQKWISQSGSRGTWVFLHPESPIWLSVAAALCTLLTSAQQRLASDGALA